MYNNSPGPTRHSKTQAIRLIDVGILGPMMIAYSMTKHPSKTMKAALALTGVATIIYNARNYIETAKRVDT